MSRRKIAPAFNGALFTGPRGMEFMVMEAEFFHEEDFSLINRDYLIGLPQGSLVAVHFHGHPVPVIRVAGGVVQLREVDIRCELIVGGRKISSRLKLRTRHPVAIRRVKF